MRWKILLALLTSFGSQAAQDPSDLLKKAHAALESRAYDKAANLTGKANAIWAKDAADSAEYADSLVLCSLALFADDREKYGFKEGESAILTRWEKESTDLLMRALTVAAIDPYVKALALELQSLLPKNKDNAEGLRGSANEIHAKLVDSILPARIVNGLYPGPGEVQPPTLAVKVDPTYAAQAIIMKIHGDVLLSIIVETDGRLSTAKVIKHVGWGLDEQAAKCLKEWKFNPGIVNGTPVRVEAKVQVTFKMLRAEKE